MRRLDSRVTQSRINQPYRRVGDIHFSGSETSLSFQIWHKVVRKYRTFAGTCSVWVLNPCQSVVACKAHFTSFIRCQSDQLIPGIDPSFPKFIVYHSCCSFGHFAEPRVGLRYRKHALSWSSSHPSSFPDIPLLLEIHPSYLNLPSMQMSSTRPQQTDVIE